MGNVCECCVEDRLPDEIVFHAEKDGQPGGGNTATSPQKSNDNKKSSSSPGGTDESDPNPKEERATLEPQASVVVNKALAVPPLDVSTPPESTSAADKQSQEELTPSDTASATSGLPPAEISPDTATPSDADAQAQPASLTSAALNSPSAPAAESISESPRSATSTRPLPTPPGSARSHYTTAAVVELTSADDATVAQDPVGAYCVFGPANNGSWLLVWSKTFVPEAVAYFRPANVEKIPQFNFNPTRKTVLAQGIHKSKEAYATGFLELIKMARKQDGMVKLLSHFSKLNLEDKTNFEAVNIFLHDKKETTVHYCNPKNEILNLSKYDGVAVLPGTSRGSSILLAMYKCAERTSLPNFVQTGGQGGATVTFLQ